MPLFFFFGNRGCTGQFAVSGVKKLGTFHKLQFIHPFLVDNYIKKEYDKFKNNLHFSKLTDPECGKRTFAARQI